MTTAVRAPSGRSASTVRLAGSPPIRRTAKPNTAVQKLIASQPKLMVNSATPATPKRPSPWAAITWDISDAAVAVLPAVRTSRAARRRNRVKACVFWSCMAMPPHCTTGDGRFHSFGRPAKCPGFGQGSVAQLQECAHFRILSPVRSEGKSGAPDFGLELLANDIIDFACRDGDDRLDRQPIGQRRNVAPGEV